MTQLLNVSFGSLIIELLERNGYHYARCTANGKAKEFRLVQGKPTNATEHRLMLSSVGSDCPNAEYLQFCVPFIRSKEEFDVACSLLDFSRD